MLNKPEILAPAGSMEALIAAVKSGADGVYAGGDRFSARAFAGNFHTKELIEAIDYCHIHNVRLYMAVNTLLKNNESSQLLDYLIPFYEAGLDGVILQDMGAAQIIHDYLPELPMHASTQLSVSSAYGAEFFRNQGFTRIVPARELSFREIREIKSKCDIEIETFVHGAMCFAYSGKCLMSSFAGGRSGNRGRCAQICRKCYSSRLFRDKYALSMKDMCTLALVPELMDAGIDSFKIEGRMKNEYYVAACVRAYRSVRDAVAGGVTGDRLNNLIDEHTGILMDIYNRGEFSRGYYYIHNGHEMLADSRPNHNGVQIGSVTGIDGPRIHIGLEQDIHAKDILEIRTGRDNIELTSNVTGRKGQTISLNGHNLKLIKKGQPVYRTRNNKLISCLAQELKRPEPPLTVKCRLIAREGEPLTLVIDGGASGIPWGKMETGNIALSGDMVESAVTNPVSVEWIQEKMAKTGDTGISFDTEIMADDNIFIRLQSIKSLKRQAAELIYDRMKSGYRRGPVILPDAEDCNNIVSCECICNNTSDRLDGVTVSVKTREQFRIINNYSFVRNIIIDYNMDGMADCRHELQYGKHLILELPFVLREEKCHEVRQWILQMDFDGVLVHNTDELGLLQDISYQGMIVASSFLYAYNKQAAAYYRRIFPDMIFMASDELTEHEISQSGSESIKKCYGYQPLMVTAQCFHKNYGSCPCDGILHLKDDRGNGFYSRSCCNMCYNVIYNGVPTYIREYADAFVNDRMSDILIDFSIEDKIQTKRIMDMFHISILEKKGAELEAACTRGHYKRGID